MKIGGRRVLEEKIVESFVLMQWKDEQVEGRGCEGGADENGQSQPWDCKRGTIRPTIVNHSRTDVGRVRE